MSNQDDVERLIRHLESTAGLIRRTIKIAEDLNGHADVQAQEPRAGANADHVLDLHEGGGSSRPRGEFTRPVSGLSADEAVQEHSRLSAELDQPVVVGGRYVVGENPTINTHYGESGASWWSAGTRVTVQQLDRSDNALVRGDDGALAWIACRCLTPAPDQPAEALAIDDDLLREVGREARAAYFANEGANKDADDDELHTGRELLASEPMQRVKAAWLAQFDGETRTYAQADAAHWHEGYQRLNAEVDRLTERASDEAQKRRDAERERDEARAERDYLSREVDHRSSQREAAYGQRDRLLDGDMELWTLLATNRNTEASRATLERLRAAQPQLPDVGPVRVDGEYLLIAGHVFDGKLTSDEHRLVAAKRLAVAAYIDARDAEAAGAGATTDDEDPRREVVAGALRGKVSHLGPVSDTLDAILAALDAHRARSGQDGACDGQEDQGIQEFDALRREDLIGWDPEDV